ncbi:hypothetical protein TNCV_2608611 [Trichonephila clavipes]|uniref:Uncharacterized protein n=1 Tax=Trichonephila clavipes TaxID=2585209 RepID=A0A8X6RYV1_TRICX|nr:hypothetical protein TNCV_2608611 [Trichonephila clavipes]
MPDFSSAGDRGPLRSSAASRITVLKPSVSYSTNSHWISTSTSSIAAIRHTAIPVRYNSTLTKVRNVLVRLYASYTRHHNNFSPGHNSEMQFV